MDLADYDRRLAEVGQLFDLVLGIYGAQDADALRPFVDKLAAHVGARVVLLFTTPKGSPLSRARLVVGHGVADDLRMELPRQVIDSIEALPEELVTTVLPSLDTDLRNGMAVGLTAGDHIVGVLLVAGLGRWPAYAGTQKLLRSLGPRVGSALAAARIGMQSAELANALNNNLGAVVSNLNHIVEEITRLDVAPPDRERVANAAQDALDAAARMGRTVRQYQSSAVERRPSLPPSTPTRPERSRVLVIDDEPLVVGSLRRLLRQHAVTVANNGSEAIGFLEQGKDFDVVLCDVLMNEVNGIEFYDYLVENHPKLVERVMFMTGGSFSPEVRTFLGRVDNPVLHKPFDAKTLRWMIGKHLARRQSSSSI